MIFNDYAVNQAKQINLALDNANKQHVHPRYQCVANDHAFAFLSKARQNPSISKVIEHNVIFNKNRSIVDEAHWLTLKDRWYDVSNRVDEAFKKMYGEKGSALRKKLIANNRVNLEKVMPRMTKLEKFVFKYLK